MVNDTILGACIVAAAYSRRDGPNTAIINTARDLYINMMRLHNELEERDGE